MLEANTLNLRTLAIVLAMFIRSLEKGEGVRIKKYSAERNDQEHDFPVPRIRASGYIASQVSTCCAVTIQD